MYLLQNQINSLNESKVWLLLLLIIFLFILMGVSVYKFMAKWLKRRKLENNDSLVNKKSNAIISSNVHRPNSIQSYKITDEDLKNFYKQKNLPIVSRKFFDVNNNAINVTNDNLACSNITYNEPIILRYNHVFDRQEQQINQNQAIKNNSNTSIEIKENNDGAIEINVNEKSEHDLPKILANQPYDANNSNKQEIAYDLNDFQTKLVLEKKQLIDEFKKQVKKDIEAKAVQMMIEAMERNAESVVSSKFSFSIKLNDNALKGKIIGKDGRNKKTFENIAGVDLIIEADQKAVTISSPNPIRREIAKKTMEKLLDVKNIEPNKIEKTFMEVKQNFENDCFEIGKDIIENKLMFLDINKELYPIVGKLSFRTSYTQNVLTHSLECALLAGEIAKQLDLDENMARRAAFFHDIGKAIDYEFDNDHVECGVRLAKQYDLEDYVINAIESHHDKVPANNPYAAIVKIVDRLSAARPGARLISNEGFHKRIEDIETICKSFKGVQDAYALKSGRQVRVIVNPEYLDDASCDVLMKEIKYRLEENDILNKQPIEIILYREYVLKSKTMGSAERFKEH